MVVTISGNKFTNSASADGGLSGSIYAPASKSSMQRACAAALVKKGESIIRNPGHSNDDKAALNVIQALGAVIRHLQDGSIQINSENFLAGKKISPVGGDLEGAVVNCGESGLGIRMFTPIIALSENEITINGEGSLLTRPMDFFDEVLPQLDVQISSNEGRLPIKLKGPLQPKNIEIDGSLSSQFLTGLLLAYAAVDAKDITIKVNDLKSKPYIDLTLQVMESFMLKVPENRNYKEFYFEETPSSTSNFVDYTVEGDWSGGAFLLVAGAIAGNITVQGLDIASTQADKKILNALEDCGADISFQNNAIKVSHSPLGISGFQFDATDCPDLFPPLAALAACCKGTTAITGVHRLAHKESNRALTIQEELRKMNIKVELKDNVMLIEETSTIKAATVHSHHDHRIAIMCAVLALKAGGETTIEEAEAVNKSYPDFYKHLQQLGASVSLQ